MKETSGTILLGGYGYDTSVHSLKSAEVISTALEVRMPDLPVPVGGHSLAAVGSMLYSCGNSTPWKIQSVQRKCYKLDLAILESDWTSSTQLPLGVDNYHTALTVRESIWYFNLNSSNVFIFDTKANNLSLIHI